MPETRAPPPDEASPALRAVLDRSEGAGGKAGLLRGEIVAFWERCARAGLRPERFEVPYDGDVDDRGRLCWAAAPVLDQVGGDLDGTGVGLLLTDQRARVLARRVADHGTAGLLDRVQLAPGFGYRKEPVLDGIRLIGVLLRPCTATARTRRPAAAQQGHHASLRMVQPHWHRTRCCRTGLPGPDQP
jgi:hypothetical protein